MKTKNLIPLTPEEFFKCHDSITISQELCNEIKRDGNLLNDVFRDDIDLYSMVEQCLVEPLGRCPETNRLVLGLTERGQLVMQIRADHEKKKMLKGVAGQISEVIRRNLGFSV